MDLLPPTAPQPRFARETCTPYTNALRMPSLLYHLQGSRSHRPATFCIDYDMAMNSRYCMRVSVNTTCY